MNKLKMVIPKGRIYKNVIKLLNDAGLDIETNDREYKPRTGYPDLEVKIMKTQNIPKLIELGSHDIGFCGHDWIVETKADVEEIMDLGFDPVRIVAAVPGDISDTGLAGKRLIVASEYENIAEDFLNGRNYEFMVLRTYGATEVFPPDDADMIIDNVSTGRTVKKHNLRILSTIMESSTRIVVNKTALADPWKGKKISEILMLLQAVFNARGKVMLEMNISEEKLNGFIGKLPCMRAPTVSPLYGNSGYAVKIAVNKKETAKILPELKKAGATDILEYEIRKVMI